MLGDDRVCRVEEAGDEDEDDAGKDIHYVRLLALDAVCDLLSCNEKTEGNEGDEEPLGEREALAEEKDREERSENSSSRKHDLVQARPGDRKTGDACQKAAEFVKREDE